ncbi:MAG: hypothetical protein H6839_11915 [Planctomycetes bacterium]|nr:hypothetical protein [Planctomycetota bacterium]
MRRFTPMLLLIACLTCWLIGCSREANNGAGNAPGVPPANDSSNQPAEKAPEPPPPDEIAKPEDFEIWLKQSPMRMKMRSMWIDCGLIVRFCTGGGQVDYDWLEASGEDIARKAASFADMWEIIRDQNRNMAAQAKKEDWFEARYASERVWSCCTDCHAENWSMHTRGFRANTIEAWLERGYSNPDAPSEGIQLSAPNNFLQIMFTMLRNLSTAITSIEQHNVEGVMTTTQVIHKIANEQVEVFRTIERHGRAIAEAASRNSTDDIKAHYITMTATCIQCHDKFVHGERKLMNPLPWKAPDEK